MIIKSLELHNFRNHASTRLDLCDGLNVLIGDNAQGKTNILESIYMTCVGRGFRSPRDRETIKFGSHFARIKTTAEKKFGKIMVEIIISTAPKKSGKQIKINSIPIAKMGELMGSVTCVFFNPDELKLIKEAPADRRRFMDIDISQIDKKYFYNLLKYARILKQRNALLKTFTKTPDEFRALEIWDNQMASVGAEIIARRMLYIEELKISAQKVHEKFTDNEILNIDIETINTTRTDNTPFSLDSLTKDFLSEISRARENDLRLKTSTIGPHRDDLAISINGLDVRQFASQGQQRTCALSMKIAELEIFERATGEKPILLLDDVFSELDKSRRARLLEIISNHQTIITTTEFSSDPKNANTKIFKISNGSLTK